MREILFKGKRVDNGEWAYGDLIHTPENKTRIIWFEPMYSYGIDFYNDFNYLVNKETIGQFTGLTDKNGKKIFEGDKTNMGIIKYYCGSFIVEKHEIGVYQTLLELSSNDETKCDLEIIGNIHDQGLAIDINTI